MDYGMRGDAVHPDAFPLEPFHPYSYLIFVEFEVVSSGNEYISSIFFPSNSCWYASLRVRSPKTSS